MNLIEKAIIAYERRLERKYKLTTENITDIIAIAKSNNAEKAHELIRQSFIVIAKNDTVQYS
jgi:hypothetical protein